MAGGGFGSAYNPPAAAPAGGSAPGGGFGSRFGGSELAPPKKKGRHGVIGLVQNLAGDTEDAITGLGTGVKAATGYLVHGTGAALTGNTAELDRQNKKFVTPIVDSYKQTYGPLAHGDFGAFGHQLYQHPLGPILDLLTVLSGGATLTARGARALELAGVEGKTVKALSKLDRPGTVTLKGPAAGEHASPLELTKPTSARPLRKAAQKAIDVALKAVPGEPGDTIAIARFGRELRRSPDIRAAQIRMEASDYLKTFAALSKKERVALQTLGRLPLPKHLEEWKQQLHSVADTGGPDAESAAGTLKLLNDPEVQQLYENPSEKMLAAHAAADTLGARSADLLGLSPEQQTLSRYRHVRLVSGAVAYTAKDARRRVRELERQIKVVGRTESTITKQASRLRTRGTPELTALRREASQTVASATRDRDARRRLDAALGGSDQLGQALASARQDVERLASGRELSSSDLLAGGLRPGSDLSATRTAILGRRFDQMTRLAAQYDRALVRVSALERRLPDPVDLEGLQSGEAERLTQVRRDIASRLQAGRQELERLAQVEESLSSEHGIVQPGIVGGPPIEHLSAEISAAGRPQPLYLPDKAELNRRGIFGRGRSATNAPRSPVHRSSGMLFRIGQLALEPDVLSPEFLRSVVYSHYVDLHDSLLEAATPLFSGDVLPDGWVYVRRLPGERIGHVEQTRGVHRKSLEQLVPDADKPAEGQLAKDRLTSTDASDALIDHGRRYAVPERLARQFESEMRASDNAALRFFGKFTSVWRALVLGLRPGFLVNNIVGNHLLYALRFAGPAGARAYYEAIRREHGDSVAAALLKRDPIPQASRAEFMREHFPEQVSGTLIDTQLPRTAAGRVVKKLSLGLVPADRAIEQTLRRSATEAALRKSPEFRQAARELEGSSQFVKLMPSQTRDFEAAAKKALDENPDLQRQVSDQVNDALGNFLQLSDFEKRTVRSFFPFYAWYRAITQIALKLPVDAPLRTTIVARIGEVGAQTRNDQLGPLPSYLESAIPLGGDTVLNGQGLNPGVSVVQLAQSLRALFPGATAQQSSDLASNLNPLIGGLVSEFQKTQDHSYGKPGGSPLGVPGDVLKQIIEGLPQFRLARAVSGHAPPSTVYSNSALERELSSFGGIPIRRINRYQTAKQAREGR